MFCQCSEERRGEERNQKNLEWDRDLPLSDLLAAWSNNLLYHAVTHNWFRGDTGLSRSQTHTNSSRPEWSTQMERQTAQPRYKHLSPAHLPSMGPNTHGLLIASVHKTPSPKKKKSVHPTSLSPASFQLLLLKQSVMIESRIKQDLCQLIGREKYKSSEWASDCEAQPFWWLTD